MQSTSNFNVSSSRAPFLDAWVSQRIFKVNEQTFGFTFHFSARIFVCFERMSLLGTNTNIPLGHLCDAKTRDRLFLIDNHCVSVMCLGTMLQVEIASDLTLTLYEERKVTTRKRAREHTTEAVEHELRKRRQDLAHLTEPDDAPRVELHKRTTAKLLAPTPKTITFIEQSVVSSAVLRPGVPVNTTWFEREVVWLPVQRFHVRTETKTLRFTPKPNSLAIVTPAGEVHAWNLWTATAELRARVPGTQQIIAVKNTLYLKTTSRILALDWNDPASTARVICDGLNLPAGSSCLQTDGKDLLLAGCCRSHGHCFRRWDGTRWSKEKHTWVHHLAGYFMWKGVMHVHHNECNHVPSGQPTLIPATPTRIFEMGNDLVGVAGRKLWRFNIHSHKWDLWHTLGRDADITGACASSMRMFFPVAGGILCAPGGELLPVESRGAKLAFF